MRTAFFQSFIVVSVLILTCASCADSTENTVKNAPVKDPVIETLSANLQISGMHCQGCVDSISKALSAGNGVISCEVSFAEEKATVEYDPDRTDTAVLIELVVKTGYQATLAESE